MEWMELYFKLKILGPIIFFGGVMLIVVIAIIFDELRQKAKKLFKRQKN